MHSKMGSRSWVSKDTPKNSSTHKHKDCLNKWVHVSVSMPEAVYINKLGTGVWAVREALFYRWGNLRHRKPKYLVPDHIQQIGESIWGRTQDSWAFPLLFTRPDQPLLRCFIYLLMLNITMGCEQQPSQGMDWDIMFSWQQSQLHEVTVKGSEENEKGCEVGRDKEKMHN